MEILSLLRFLVGGIFLGFAAISDVRTRRVPNRVWILLGLVGFIILAWDLQQRFQASWVHYLIFIPAGVLFFEVYIDRDPIIDDEGFHFVPLAFLLYGLTVVVLIAQVFLLWGNPEQMHLFYQLLTIPIMIIVAHILYQTGLLRGGADAKALMSLAVLAPFYPMFYGFPLVSMSAGVADIMSIAFPFALVILMNSAILMIFVPLVFLAINARRRDLEFPQCLVGYKVSLNKFPRFTWLMERVEEGKLRVVLLPRRGGDQKREVRVLLEMGRDKAWATPQLPFMVPMFFGFLISFLVGNLILGLVYSFVGFT
ncbi:MAG: A24 family peptidase C-terminal domain-containing protein [Thermoplasmata archaeon]